uniref:Pectinesterase inhibitor domain-containing protein n=1 Tax=Leersia perrieri TaxID=77586 RepID=A0A0D9X4A7_9ORYZ
MPKAIISLTAVTVALLAAVAGGGDTTARCAPVPSMTAEEACSAVCGTDHMRSLCHRTLLPPRRRVAAAARRHAVTRYISAAARVALDAYAATAAAKRVTEYSAAVPADERTAHERCIDGYDLAARFMARLAVVSVSGDVARSGCDAAARRRVREDFEGCLDGMDVCRRRLFGYPASPLYGRNLADRNMTLLVALLSNLVISPAPAT